MFIKVNIIAIGFCDAQQRVEHAYRSLEVLLYQCARSLSRRLVIRCCLAETRSPGETEIETHKHAHVRVVLESFAYNYHDGKDMDDLLAARDYMVKQADKAGVSLAPSYLWSRFKGGPDLDTIWFTVREDLTAFAAQSETFGAAPELAGVGARFGTVASCESNLSVARAIFQGSGIEEGPPQGSAFISSNACMLRDGVGAGDLADLEGHINGVLGGISAYNKTTFISATPFTSGPNSADLYLFAINESQSAWAAGVAAFQASAGGPALGRHFNSVLDCSTALWFSQQVVGGED